MQWIVSVGNSFCLIYKGIQYYIVNGDVNTRLKYFKESTKNDYLPSTYIGCRANVTICVTTCLFGELWVADVW